MESNVFFMEFWLDSPLSMYYAGQTIKGQLRISLPEDTKVRNIMVQFFGGAHTSWHEREEHYQDNKMETYYRMFTANEQYILQKLFLLGSDNGPEIRLSAGVHDYPFGYVLPMDIPSTFKCADGFIRYTIKATIKSNWRFDKKLEVEFFVISPVDLNQIPGCMVPKTIGLEESFCHLCCASQPFRATITTPGVGFIAGQHIPIKIEVENESNVKINAIRVILQQHVVCIAYEPRYAQSRRTRNIAEVEVGHVEAYSIETIRQMFMLPEILEPDNIFCGIIGWSYEMKFLFEVSGMHCNLKRSMQVFIGNCPIPTVSPNDTTFGTTQLYPATHIHQPDGLCVIS